MRLRKPEVPVTQFAALWAMCAMRRVCPLGARCPCFPAWNFYMRSLTDILLETEYEGKFPEVIGRVT